MFNAEQMNKLAQWRMKAQDRTLSQEELREAILLLRQNRVEAATQAKAARKPTRSADAMLDDL
jgi:hypothetical protein